MKKIITLSLLALFLATTMSAQVNLAKRFNPVAGNVAAKNNAKSTKAKMLKRTKATPCADGEGLVATTILAEDFSKFTAGSESAHDTTRLDDADGFIDDKYFNTPGWVGLEVYQAGGMAYLGYSTEFEATGLLSTPLLDTKGAVTIKVRVRSLGEEGDYLMYNILDPYTFDVLDSNYKYIGAEWTDVEFVSTYGDKESYVYIFTNSYDVLIDDIVIEKVELGVPVVGEEQNMTGTSFTANWESVTGADAYDVFGYAKHKVGEDGLCVLADMDFANMVNTGGTWEKPLKDYDNMTRSIEDICPSDFPGWMLYCPCYADGMAAVSGLYANYGEHGYILSPELDLSGNEGKANLSFRVMAGEESQVVVSVLSLVDGYFEAVYKNEITPTGEWQDVELELTGCGKQSYVQILYTGATQMLLDDLKLTQQLPAGTVYSHQFLQKVVEGTSLDVVIPERYHGDDVTYAVRAVKYIYEEYGGETYVVDAIESDFSEPRTVIAPVGINAATTTANKPAGAAFDLQGRRVNADQLQRGSLYIQGGKVRVK